MTVLPNAIDAAHRARTIAATARTRATTPTLTADTRTALATIADLLDDAARSLETEEPATFDGITVTNTLPFDASMALHAARQIADDNPSTGIPENVDRYITAPVFRNPIDLPTPRLPHGHPLTRKEADLIARLDTVHTGYLTATTSAELTTAALTAALELHWKLGRLADTAAHTQR
ncbi:hypothetical protein ACWEGS_28765 [Streptomyces sp. NPDC004822]